MQNLDQKLSSIGVIFERKISAQKYAEAGVEALDELAVAKQEVDRIKSKYRNLLSRMSGLLGVHVRARLPALNIALEQGCRISYFSKTLEFIPNIQQQIWEVKSPDAKFLKAFYQVRPRLSLSTDYADLANGIVEFYVGFYKSLGEDIENVTKEGSIIIEHRRETFGALASYANSGQPE